MWTYSVGSGQLFHNGKFVSAGYSGKAHGKNNRSLQGVQDIGPIPAGLWKIINMYDSRNVGPFTLTLWKADDSNFDDFDQVTGRGAFRIHGDSIKAPGTASKGCIILPRLVRQGIWASGDRELTVTA